MNKPRVFVTTMIFFAALASIAAAETTAFTADLKGSSEVPPTESSAKGKAEVTYDSSTKTLRWTISYWGLTGSARMSVNGTKQTRGSCAMQSAQERKADCPRFHV